MAVAVEGGSLVPLAGISELGPGHDATSLSAADRLPAAAFPAAEAVFRPVVPHPGKIICVGLNYRAHATETQRDPPDHPVLFTKFATTLTGPFDDVPCPAESEAVDYEGELAVVIGRRCRRIAEADALSAVLGYTIANDVTMRDWQDRSPQWLQGKAWDATTPLGPHLVTPDEFGDPQDKALRTTVDGRTVQEASTAQMIFPVAALISAISAFTTLEPGDLILTGTPAGVGVSREPPLLLGHGETVTVEIEGIGRIESRFVEEAPSRRI
jgi:acylpyruvate hydrolase